MKNQGFTLIELMVVVLIIGILSAIALPQYEMAVEKSRITEALINTKAITDAAQRYFQANPNETTITSRRQIADVDLRGGTWTNDTTFTTDLFIYQLGGENGMVRAYRTDTNSTSSYIYMVWQQPDLGNGAQVKGCEIGNADRDTGEQMCKFFTGH